MSVTIKRNLILTALAGIFFLVAKAGFDELAKSGIEGIGMLPLLFGGLGFIGFATALIVRLWGTETE